MICLKVQIQTLSFLQTIHPFSWLSLSYSNNRNIQWRSKHSIPVVAQMETDSSKQAQEIVFSQKNRATNHESNSFNNMIINMENVLKHCYD